MAKTVLVTGAAGFIGAALSQRLLRRGDRVVGIDSLNSYYDPALKHARLRQVEAVAGDGEWRFERMALEDADALMSLFAEERPQVVVNLAAQAGVRYSLENPAAYIQSTGSGIFWRVAGTMALITWCTPQAVRCTAAIAICRSMSSNR